MQCYMDKDNNSEHIFVVMMIEDFTFEAGNKIPVNVDKGKMIGFLPVYATREDALADYPNRDLMMFEKGK